MYLTQSQIAADPAMHARVAQCAAEQHAPGVITDGMILAQVQSMLGAAA